MLYHEIANAGGQRLAYVRTNEWKDRIILFFHGFCGSKEYFPDIVNDADICIVSFDRPGVGESAVEPYYSMESFLANVYSVLKDHNVQSVKVIGHGAGVCYDAYALCQKRDDLTISKEIPVYVWHGTKDTTTPLSYTAFFKTRYNVQKEHIIENIGHMLYMPYWQAIVEEAK